MKIAVFCGSRYGASPAYAEGAAALGQFLAREGHSLVYGGEECGLMKALADAVYAGGGNIIGVVPDIPLMTENVYPHLTKRVDVKTMQDRKGTMLALADAFLCLPGGIGTLDEFGDALTAIQLGLAEGKKMILWNTEGYYAPLRDYLAHTVQEGFMDAWLLEGILVSDSPEALRKFLER